MLAPWWAQNQPEGIWIFGQVFLFLGSDWSRKMSEPDVWVPAAVAAVSDKH